MEDVEGEEGRGSMWSTYEFGLESLKLRGFLSGK